MVRHPQPTERDHYPVDLATGRYISAVRAYLAALWGGKRRSIEAAHRKIEPARVKAAEAIERFNAKFPKEKK